MNEETDQLNPNGKHLTSVRNPKNSTLDLKTNTLSKPSHASFKLSNASQKYIKQKTYKPGKKRGKRLRRGKDPSAFKKQMHVPTRYVLEKNPFMLGKRRPMNEKNFYEYLNGIPSLKKEEKEEKEMDLESKRKKEEFKDLRKLEKENLQLNEDLKDLNEKLSQMIGKKGYQNLLEQLKENKKVFVERPVSRQVKTLNGELQNGDKILSILGKEKARVEKMLEKVISPVSFSEIMRKINDKKKEIKELKSQNFELVMENKKVGKMLENGEMGGQGILKKLLMQYNNVRAKNNEIESEIERLEGVRKELSSKKCVLEEKNQEVEGKMREVGMENWDPDVEKKFEEAKKTLEKEENRQKIIQKNFKTKENELNRIQKKKEKYLELLRKELKEKKSLLEKMKKEGEEVAKEKQKVTKEEEEKRKEGKGKEDSMKMVENLKNFQKKSTEHAKIISKDPIYSTKTDQENESEVETEEKKKDAQDAEEEEEKIEEESEDEVSKLLKKKGSRIENKKKVLFNDEKEENNENKSQKENRKEDENKEIEGQKTPTLNGSIPEVSDEKNKKSSIKVLEEKNNNVGNPLNQYQSFAKVNGNDLDNKENELDDFDELIGMSNKKEERNSNQQTKHNQEEEIGNDNDFDFIDPN